LHVVFRCLFPPGPWSLHLGESAPRRAGLPHRGADSDAQESTVCPRRQRARRRGWIPDWARDSNTILLAEKKTPPRKLLHIPSPFIALFDQRQVQHLHRLAAESRETDVYVQKEQNLQPKPLHKALVPPTQNHRCSEQNRRKAVTQSHGATEKGTPLHARLAASGS
jgi:hypothetical protein